MSFFGIQTYSLTVSDGLDLGGLMHEGEPGGEPIEGDEEDDE
jgi:hypothetical protein